MTNSRAGKWTRVFVDGYDLTIRGTDVIPPHSVHDEVPVDGYTQDHCYLNGMADAITSFTGFFDQSTGKTHDALNVIASGDTQKLITVALGDNALPAIGDTTFSMPAVQSSYVVNPNLKAAIVASGTFKSLGTPAEVGVLLADLTGISGDGDTASVNNGASSADGGVGYLHLYGISAGDTVVIKIQDSANDAVWADLITFTLDGSAIGAERIEVTGTVDQYLQVTYDVTGTGVDFDFAVAFHRN